MRITLTEAEIRRAIQWYLASKSDGARTADYDVTLHPRGKHGIYATAEVLKPVPTLTDVATRT